MKLGPFPVTKKGGNLPCDAKPDYDKYQIEGCLARERYPREIRLKRKSCFILATNFLSAGALPDTEVLVQ